MVYENPVIPGFHPDPSVCRVDDDFFLVTSSFEYFPAVPLFHSRNLVDWEQIGHVLTRESQVLLKDCNHSGGIFAPTIRYSNGRFYMVTTNRNKAHAPQGNFYVWTDDIRREWSEPIWVDMPGGDPDLFFDDDGTVWFSSTYGHSRINIETGELQSTPTRRWPGIGGTKSPEAPHIYKIDGLYYTMLAEGGTERGHMVTIARSKQIGGPYQPCPYNPLLSHRSTAEPLQATGHGDLIQDPEGRWWIVFLATRPVRNVHLLGRETCLAPVFWTEDGWPSVNKGEPVPLKVDIPGLPRQTADWRSWHDDFDASKLKPAWNFLRNPYPEVWSLSENTGRLTLHCSNVGLDLVDSPAWVGRRLQHFHTELKTELEFHPGSEEEEAGITLFLRHHVHYDIVVTQREQRRVVMTRRLLDTLNTYSDPVPVEKGPLQLSILTDPEWIDLGIVTQNGRITIDKGEAKFLSTEVGGRFTGLFVALYAQGAGDGSSRDNAATFAWFDYKATGEST